MNDFGAVKETQSDYIENTKTSNRSSLFLHAESVTGKCYVLIFSPHHNKCLADLALEQILLVIREWTRLYAAYADPNTPLLQTNNSEFSARNVSYRWMQIFENKGSAMGCSNPHPHCQVWITSSLPEEPAQELKQLKQYYNDKKGRNLLVDYAQLEIEKDERIVFQNESFVIVCPWWAIWPYEVMIIAKQHKHSLLDLNETEKLQFAEAISEVTRRYDNLFKTSFPYSRIILNHYITNLLIIFCRLRNSPSSSPVFK